MKNHLNRLIVFSSKIDRRHIQLAIAILALAMLILGAGAPTDSGGTIH